MSKSSTVPCQQIKHLDNSSPIADLASFGSVTRRFGQYSEVNSSIHLYVVLGAINNLHVPIIGLFWSGKKILLSKIICSILKKNVNKFCGKKIKDL